MMLQAGILIVGFLFLVKGADWFVEGSASIARKFGIPPADYRTYHCCNGNEYAGGCCEYYCSDAAERRNYDRK